LDWSFNPPQFEETIISVTADWRNAVISKDGRFIALLENIASNVIIMFDLQTQTTNQFILRNPTFSEGLSTSEVQYADAMEFDATSTSIMYDALNSVSSSNSGTIDFWDIGFLEFWNPQSDTWALGSIDKLIGSLPEGISIANPAFSKNSPFIVAMDIFDGTESEIIGVNLETRDIKSIFPNTGLGYPNYSRDDNFLIYDLEFFGYTDLGILQLNEDKISTVSNSDNILLQGGKWGVWFSNGKRVLSDTEELVDASGILQLSPNPATNVLNVNFDNSGFDGKLMMDVQSIDGKRVYSQVVENSEGHKISLDTHNFAKGIYILSIRSNSKITSERFVKH
jgi:hypothetical protein